MRFLTTASAPVALCGQPEKGRAMGLSIHGHKKRPELPKNDRPRVYVSGPITMGNRNHNLFQALEVHERLIVCGFAPLNPMMTMLCPFEPRIRHDAWISVDLAWVQVSDMVLRLPGASKGGDQEVAYAESIGCPVYTPETFPWNLFGKDAVVSLPIAKAA